MSPNSPTYLDSSATSQKPTYVIDKMKEYDLTSTSNVHRGAHTLSRTSTEMYESSRSKLASFINARSPREVVFTSGATGSLNMLAQILGGEMEDGDEVVLSVMEHHSNIVPWQMIRRATGKDVRIKWCGLDGERGGIDYDHLESLVNERTKVVSIVHTSNTLGCTTDTKRIAEIKSKLAHPSCVYIVDGCQSLPHIPIDVQSMKCDFFVASGHKMCGPTGVGMLWGKEEIMEGMEPVLGGGEMIDEVTFEGSTYAALPGRFEAGTPCISQAIGFGFAVDYLNSIGGMEKVHEYEKKLGAYLYSKLSAVDGVKIYGPSSPDDRSALCSFSVDGIHVSDIASFLDLENVAVRAGHHCTQPLHTYLGISHTARASCYVYNDERDIDIFVE
eukprot:CAMPEP_0118640224 /NCGR_PEP_ID=MMETSP0785-20121206/4638_1 /TAXON_ID=91992 /ORGANISM="Bolidomonas pacifica, Strain CCMP 1866" /LENGTH=386 /DNA_ID=CAMNT_0006531595 /DNA_START=209 /DNA_END=1366 /DNA_ORIENTATION=-